jgi:hypothetical protein
MNDFPSNFLLPSGKHTKNYGKSPFFMGKSTFSMGHFQKLCLTLPEGISKKWSFVASSDPAISLLGFHCLWQNALGGRPGDGFHTLLRLGALGISW